MGGTWVLLLKSTHLNIRFSPLFVLLRNQNLADIQLGHVWVIRIIIELVFNNAVLFLNLVDVLHYLDFNFGR